MGIKYINRNNENVEIKSFSNYNCIGDGVTDDTNNFELAISECYRNGFKLISNSSKKYLIKQPMIINELPYIDGGGCEIILGEFDTTTEHAIKLSNVNDLVISNIKFTIKFNNPCDSLMGLFNCENITFINCEFNSFSDEGINNHCVMDLYTNNKYINFIQCEFNQLSGGTSGGIWVRNFDTVNKTHNINFNNCIINKKGADEVLAVWGWMGEMSNIYVTNCKFYNYDSDNTPDYLITLGSSGVAKCEVYNCDIVSESNKAIFKCIGDNEALVSNCNILSLNSNSDSGNLIVGDDDSNFKIKDCNVTLTCNTGYIAYKAKYIENNNFNVTSSYGFMSCNLVKNNIINGEIGSYIFGSCENVIDNNFETTSITGRVLENCNLFLNNIGSISATISGANTSFYVNQSICKIINNNIDCDFTGSNIKLLNLTDANGKYYVLNNLINISNGYYSTNNTKSGTFISNGNYINDTLENI